MNNKIMKTIFQVGALIVAVALAGSVRAANPAPGYVDFGKFSPTPGGEFVEVNVTSNLITMVTNLAKDEPEVMDVLKGLKAIRVNVLGVNAANRDEMQNRIQSVRSQLDDSGWERVVSVMNGKDDVGVYMKTRGTEAVEGVVVTVLEGKGHAVFVNVVGDIRPEKLTMLGERFNIEPLKHLPGKPAKHAKLNDEQ
jgi:hypothetical protein